MIVRLRQLCGVIER